MNSKFRAFCYSRGFHAFFIAFIISAFAGACFTTALEKRRVQSAVERAENMAEIQVSRLERTLNNLFSVTETLYILLKAEGGDMGKFESLAEEIIGDLPLRNITLAPDGIVSEIWPLEGNEAAVGHDILNDPLRVREAQLARDSHELTLSGPYELKQGGTGIIARLPVYLNEGTGASRFWGFACVTVDLPEGLRDAEMEKLEQQGYAYELWRISPDTQSRQTIMKSEAALSAGPVSDSISLPNSTWYLEVSPVGGWYQKEVIFMEAGLAILFALLCAFLARSGVALEESRHSLQITLDQQTANYRLMDEMNESLRAFRHDTDNHLLSLNYLLTRGETDAAKEYIHAISASLSETLHIVNTENYVFDAIVGEKLSKAEKKGISISRDISIPGCISIDNEDWSILFGNALDNAVEACINAAEAGEGAEAELKISVHYHNGILSACISNTSLRPEKESGGFYRTGKADKKNHGLGLKQMKKVVSKYGGVMETVWEDGIFTLSFMLLYV